MRRGELSTIAYEEQLAQLLDFVRAAPTTARDVAQAFKCSRGTAHKRLGDLVKSGLVKVAGRERRGLSGPESVVYAFRR